MYLAHHGVRGQKWGGRRYQNEDGSYKKNAEGIYSDTDDKPKKKELSKAAKEGEKLYKKGKGLYDINGYTDRNTAARMAAAIGSGGAGVYLRRILYGERTPTTITGLGVGAALMSVGIGNEIYNRVKTHQLKAYYDETHKSYN